MNSADKLRTACLMVSTASTTAILMAAFAGADLDHRRVMGLAIIGLASLLVSTFADKLTRAFKDF